MASTSFFPGSQKTRFALYYFLLVPLTLLQKKNLRTLRMI